MKKALLAGVLMMIGALAGAVLPGVLAQDAAPTPAPAPARVEQFCELKGALGTGDQRAQAVARVNTSLADRAAQGWVLVSTPTFPTGTQGSTWSELMLCYTRRAP